MIWLINFQEIDNNCRGTDLVAVSRYGRRNCCMKKLVKKSMPKTISAFWKCRCKKTNCLSTSKGSGSAGTNAMNAGVSTSTRYS